MRNSHAMRLILDLAEAAMDIIDQDQKLPPDQRRFKKEKWFGSKWDEAFSIVEKEISRNRTMDGGIDFSALEGPEETDDLTEINVQRLELGLEPILD